MAYTIDLREGHTFKIKHTRIYHNKIMNVNELAFTDVKNWLFCNETLQVYGSSDMWVFKYDFTTQRKLFQYFVRIAIFL